MSWLRYSDDDTRNPIWDGVPYETRWHYRALVECCVGRYDGRIPLRLARRCSDVDDPDRCLQELAAAGLLKLDDDTATVVYVDDHVCPPHLREEVLRPRQARNSAEYRRRKCERGEHSRYCPKATCPVKLARVSPVIRPMMPADDTGAGRERETLNEERPQEGDPWSYSEEIA